MEIPILTRTAATTPAIGNGFIFFDTANSNALTVKFSDCTFKVLSAEPYQVKPSQSLLDAQADFLDGLKCALKNGQLTAVEYTNIMTTFQLYYQSNIDVNGNLNQAITTSPLPSTSVDFGISTYTPLSGNVIYLTYTDTVAQNRAMTLEVDKMGGIGDITVAFTSPVVGITLAANSYVSDSLGGVTTSALNTIIDGTSVLSGLFVYSGVSITPGTYTGTLTISRGSINRYISVTIEVLP